MGIIDYFEGKIPGEEQMRLYDFQIKEERRHELPFDPETEISDSDWQGMKEQLDRFRQDKDWGYFSSQAMAMKILFPEKANDLNLNAEAWQGMKEGLEELRQEKDWWNFHSQAMNMKILSAYKVEITNGGIECTMRPPEDFREPKTPRPERRKF